MSRIRISILLILLFSMACGIKIDERSAEEGSVGGNDATVCLISARPNNPKMGAEVEITVDFPGDPIEATLLGMSFKLPGKQLKQTLTATKDEEIVATFKLTENTELFACKTAIKISTDTTGTLPTCTISGPSIALINKPISFTVAATNAVSATASFDGAAVPNYSVGSPLSFTPTTKGSLKAKVEVANAAGQKSACEVVVPVTDNANVPLCSITGPSTGDINTQLSYKVNVSPVGSLASYYIDNPPVAPAKNTALNTAQIITFTSATPGLHKIHVDVADPANASLASACEIAINLNPGVQNACDGSASGYPTAEANKFSAVEISNVQQLKALQGTNSKGKYIKLTADLDLTLSTFASFALKDAIFDGQNHTINNLRIDRQAGDGVGLFSTLDCSVVRNLNLQNADIRGRDNVSAVAGQADGSRLENIRVSGTNRIAGRHNVGGVVGKANRTVLKNVEVRTGSELTGKITGLTSVGGVVGSLTAAPLASTKVDCALAQILADVIVEGEINVGGVTGSMQGGCAYQPKLTSSNIVGSDKVGGVFGQVYNAKIYEGDATLSIVRTVTTPGRAGGFIGFADRLGEVVSSRFDGKVDANISGGLIGGTADAVGEARVSLSRSAGEIIGHATAGGLVGRTAIVDLDKSSSTAKVTGDDAGGLLGEANNGGSISQCFASPNTMVVSKDRGGGLVGYARLLKIENSYATGQIRGKGYIGGIIGQGESMKGFAKNYSTAWPNSTARASEPPARRGGMAGAISFQGSVRSQANFYDKQESNMDDSPVGTGLTTREMKKSTTYNEGSAFWDFSSTWFIEEDVGYPTLRNAAK